MPLEDVEAKFEYHEIGATEILLPNEIQAKLIQTFPNLDQHTAASPHVVELAMNGSNWPKSDKSGQSNPRGRKPKTTTVYHQPPTWVVI